MSVVHTAFGPGRIVGEDVTRGRKQFLVEGASFKTWIDEADAQIDYRTSAFGDAPSSLGDHADTNDGLEIHDDNSVDLPYNPEPQFPVEQFHGEQNIQPNHLLDAEDRTSDSNSRTFKDVSGRPYPGPSSDNFAKSSYNRYSLLGDIDEYVHPHHTPYHEDKPSASAESPRHIIPPSIEDDEELTYPEGISEKFEHDLEHGGTMRNKWRHYHDPMDTHHEKNRPAHRPGANPDRSSFYAAGLSDKYIDLTASVDHYNDPIQRFRDDPLREIQRVGHILQANHDPRIAEYAELVASDPIVRKAAWSDVRSKAVRLRHEGKVDVHDVGPNRIYATVQGDNGEYDVMLVTGGFSGFGNGHGVTEYSCSCPWGVHAFQRQKLHVGRLCSHAYSALLEMQSREMKDVAKKQPSGRPYQKRGGVSEDIGDYLSPLISEHGPGVPHRPQRPEAQGGRKVPLNPETGEPSGPSVPLHLRRGGVTEDYKKWTDEENDGHIDNGGLTNFISLPTNKDSKDPGTKGREPYHKDEVEELYNYEEEHRSGAPARKYDERSYTFDPDKVYKNADALRLRPHSLTPDFRFIEGEGDGEEWTDVEKDDRETTGPDQIQHFSNRTATPFPHDKAWQERNPHYDEGKGWLSDPGNYHNAKEMEWYLQRKHQQQNEDPNQLKMFEASKAIDAAMAAIRTAADESDRDGSGEVQPDEYRDFNGGGKLLDKLRKKIEDGPGSHLQHMEDRNDEVRDIVDELHEKGYAAENLVASRQFTADGNFLGVGGPNWMDETFSGSGPDPKVWHGDSKDYVEEHERPHHEDVTDLGDEEIIKYTSPSDRPQQGPGKRGAKHTHSPDDDGYCTSCDKLTIDPVDHPDFEKDDPGHWSETGPHSRSRGHIDKGSSVDPIDHFYKSGAADAIKHGSSSGGGGFSDDAIASQARGFLRTAGRNFSLAEQRALEDEEHHLGARNLDGLDLVGTHYEDS